MCEGMGQERLSLVLLLSLPSPSPVPLPLFQGSTGAKGMSWGPDCWRSHAAGSVQHPDLTPDAESGEAHGSALGLAAHLRLATVASMERLWEAISWDI